MLDLYQILNEHISFFSKGYEFRMKAGFHDGSNKKLYPSHIYSIDERTHNSYFQLNHGRAKTNNVSIESKAISQRMEGYLERQQQLLDRQIQNNSFNILLIDDDRDILLTFKEILQTRDYKIEAFSDSEEALKHFSHIDPAHYDLVLMDIRMPSLNGVQLYNKLKAMSPDMKVLFITSLDAIEELVSLLPEVEMNDILRKPIEHEHLLAKVNAALQNQT
jgi:CheY-like chemotaxis protein